MLYYILPFILLVLFSSFFSSAETSLLSLNSIRLNHRAKKGSKKAKLLLSILKNPDEFFATILIGNNVVNIAAASISTIFFTRIFLNDEKMILISSTVFTTLIILIFAEIIPKSYAFRHGDKLSSIYAMPIRFFSILFYPFVKIFALLSSILISGKGKKKKKDITTDELKHFLASEVQFFKHNPDNLKMINEILDIGNRDIKSIMTPRVDMIAIEISDSLENFKKTIIEKEITKVPLYKENLDNIVAVIYLKKIFPSVISKVIKKTKLSELAVKPFFISEYSSVNYVLKEFKKNNQDLAVVLDEYGITIGIITLNDIFREILGEFDIGKSSIAQTEKGAYLIRGELPVDEVNDQLNIELPMKKDFTTISGLFTYFFGRLPKKGSRVSIGSCILEVEKMGDRKIMEISLKKSGN
ncbi:MAG: HlyC/CorC family transporter [Candidatus Aminicenantes bacterium]|nr:HlyC/CorC family transporter [Candidatus Aminicenantes bacterium]